MPLFRQLVPHRARPGCRVGHRDCRGATGAGREAPALDAVSDAKLELHRRQAQAQAVLGQGGGGTVTVCLLRIPHTTRRSPVTRRPGLLTRGNEVRGGRTP